MEYAAKMNAMGINEKSLAGENNPIADHVATIGQDKMRLLSSNTVVHAPTMGDLGGAGGRNMLGTTCEGLEHPSWRYNFPLPLTCSETAPPLLEMMLKCSLFEEFVWRRAACCQKRREEEVDSGPWYH